MVVVVVNTVVEAPTVDVLVLVTAAVIVLVEAGRVVVFVVAAVTTRMVLIATPPLGLSGKYSSSAYRVIGSDLFMLYAF